MGTPASNRWIRLSQGISDPSTTETSHTISSCPKWWALNLILSSCSMDSNLSSTWASSWTWETSYREDRSSREPPRPQTWMMCLQSISSRCQGFHREDPSRPSCHWWITISRQWVLRIPLSISLIRVLRKRIGHHLVGSRSLTRV